MTLLFNLPRHLLSAAVVALVCVVLFVVPVAYAAELEGTIVSPDAPPSTSTPVESAPVADVPPEPDQPTAPAAEQAPPAPRTQQWQNHNNWERDWEKNLSQAFGGDHQNGNDDEGGPSFMEALMVLFAVIALIIVLCSPLILMGVYLALRHKSKVRHQQALNNNIDKLLAAGRDIPVELLRGDEPKSDEPVGSRDKGIRNIFLGTGWLVFLTIMVGFDVGSAGFIWIALGASQVVIWYLNRPNESEQAGQQD